MRPWVFGLSVGLVSAQLVTAEQLIFSWEGVPPDMPIAVTILQRSRPLATRPLDILTPEACAERHEGPGRICGAMPCLPPGQYSLFITAGEPTPSAPSNEIALTIPTPAGECAHAGIMPLQADAPPLVTADTLQPRLPEGDPLPLSQAEIAAIPILPATSPMMSATVPDVPLQVMPHEGETPLLPDTSAMVAEVVTRVTQTAPTPEDPFQAAQPEPPAQPPASEFVPLLADTLAQIHAAYDAEVQRLSTEYLLALSDYDGESPAQYQALLRHHRAITQTLKRLHREAHQAMRQQKRQGTRKRFQGNAGMSHR